MTDVIGLAVGAGGSAVAVVFTVLWALQYRKLVGLEYDAVALSSQTEKLEEAKKTIQRLNDRIKELEHADIDNTPDNELAGKLSRGVHEVEDENRSPPRLMPPSFTISEDSDVQG